MSAPRCKDVYLVIGGSGFVGRHIVERLVARDDIVSVFDIVKRHDDVPFYSGDIINERDVLDSIRKSGATCIIHTASPPPGGKDTSIYYKVNVDGTRAVINAAIAVGVRKLVYTSSADIVFDGKDVVHLDERAPYPENLFDAYSDSKAQGEALVLAANGKGGLLTVAIRPGGVFGPGDIRGITDLYEVYRSGQTHVQLGSNDNIVDYVYVGNLAHAHLLAADKLSGQDDTSDDTAFRASLDQVLPFISVTTKSRPVPTSRFHPPGPHIPPRNRAAINAPLDSSDTTHTIERNRYDQFSTDALDVSSISPLQVAGQVFFITNGEPIYQWDFFRAIWLAFDPPTEQGLERAKRTPWVIPRKFAMVLGYLGETWTWLCGKEAVLTRYRVAHTCSMRYHNVEKARRVLGYEPEVGLEEGIQRMVEWFKAEKGLA